MPSNKEQKGDRSKNKVIPFPPYENQVRNFARFLGTLSPSERAAYYGIANAKYAWFRNKRRLITEIDDPEQPSGTEK